MSAAGGVRVPMGEETTRVERSVRAWKADAVESLATDTAPAPLPTTHQEEAAMSDSTDSEMVAVLGHDVHVVEYQGQRVVALRQIDELHERPTGTAKRQFKEHRERFEEGRDFHEITGYEIRTQFSGVFSPHAKSVILITERGYGKIVKGWNDDRSWALLDAMQDAYFALKGNPDLVRDGLDNAVLEQIDEELDGLRSLVADNQMATLSHIEKVFGEIADERSKLAESWRTEMKALEDALVEALDEMALVALLHGRVA